MRAACRAHQMVSPREHSVLCWTYTTLLLLCLHADHDPSGQHQRLPWSVRLSKPRTDAQPPGVIFGLAASQAQALKQLGLSPSSCFSSQKPNLTLPSPLTC